MIATLFIFYVEQLYIKINALLLSVYPRYKTAHLINAFGINLNRLSWRSIIFTVTHGKT